MAAVRAAFHRQVKVLVTVTAAMAIALTSLVIAAPSANAAYKPQCFVAKTHVRRGGQDAALCTNFAPFTHGVAYVVSHRHRKHHGRRHHIIILKRFRTGHAGNALFGFRIKPRVPLGLVHVRVKAGNRMTSFKLYVKPRRHHH